MDASLLRYAEGPLLVAMETIPAIYWPSATSKAIFQVTGDVAFPRRCQMAKAKVEIYTKSWCPHCRAAKALLRQRGVTDWIEVDIEVQTSKRAEMIQRSGGRTTVPQIFIDGRHIGGSSDLHALDHADELVPLLAGAGNAQAADLVTEQHSASIQVGSQPSANN